MFESTSSSNESIFSEFVLSTSFGMNYFVTSTPFIAVRVRYNLKPITSFPSTNFSFCQQTAKTDKVKTVYSQQRIEEFCILLRLVDFLSCIKVNTTFTAASQYLPP